MPPATPSVKRTAVLDACVLYSATLRGFLLRLAEDGLFTPFWSEDIHGEWLRSLLRNRPDLIPEKLERTRRNMDSRFPDSLIRGHEPIIPTLTLPDQNDRHVLAVAIHAKARYIVTTNLTDFPKLILAPYQVEAILPDDFSLRVIELDSEAFTEAVAKHRASLTRPPKTVGEYLATLEKQGLIKTTAFLREHQSGL